MAYSFSMHSVSVKCRMLNVGVIFTARHSACIARAVVSIAIPSHLSVCLSVHLSHAGIVKMTARSMGSVLFTVHM